jgi:hypothetical protein
LTPVWLAWKRTRTAVRSRLTATAARYGLTADDLRDEAHRFFALPLAAQLAEVDQHEAELCREGFTDTDLAHVRGVLTRYDRPMD